jgi:methyltransferase (TIGR00027 family)
MIPEPAVLAAAYRARESDRPDAVFRDPHARALAGAVSAPIARAMAHGDKIDWLFAARTYVFDRLIAREIADGADMVLSLAAGLDARPYRLNLPASLTWVEADLPDILDYKADVLAGAAPACQVERIAIALVNPDARRGLFADVGRRAKRAVVITENVLLYLMPDEVHALARDLSAMETIRRWMTDLVSPSVLTMLAEHSGDIGRRAGAPYLFSPPQGPAFFERDGWELLGVRSIVKAALKLERLPISLRLMAMMPDGQHPGDRPWAGVCLFGKA